MDDRFGPLSLSHFDPAYTRTRFDNGAIHEYETQLHNAMVRMGLASVAIRDLLGFVLHIADAIAIQQRMDGYHEGRREGIKDVLDHARQLVAEQKQAA